jgi:hypothetical protein
MKQKSLVKRTVCALTASALLASTGWAQPPPGKEPRKPIETGPKFDEPVDPKAPFLMSAPKIQSPVSHMGVDLDKPLIVSGTGMNRGLVRVTVKGSWEETSGKRTRPMKRTLSESNAYNDSRGNWKTEPIKLNIPVRAEKVKFEIIAIQNVNGKTSQPTVITVGPAIKMLEFKPVPRIAIAAPMLSITSPKDGSKVSEKDKRIILKGTAIGDKTLNVQMTMNVHTERGNFLTGKQTSVGQVHRRVDNVPIKDGKWEASLDVTTKSERITKVTYEIIVFLKNGGATKTIKLSR